MIWGTLVRRFAGAYLVKKLFEPFGYTFKASLYNDPRVKKYLVDDPGARDVLNEVCNERKNGIDYALGSDLIYAVTGLFRLGKAQVPEKILDNLAKYTSGAKVEHMREAVKNKDWFDAVSSYVLDAVSVLKPKYLAYVLPAYTMYQHERVVSDFRRRMKEFRRDF